MDKRVIRGIYLYEFKLGTTAKEADEKINAAFGQECSTIRTAYRWYQKFRKGDESLEGHEGRGRHSDVDEDKLLVTDAKIVPYETVAPQHRPLICALKIAPPRLKQVERCGAARIKCHDCRRNLEEDDRRDSSQSELGITKPGRGKVDKQAWLWTDDVKAKVREKKSLITCFSAKRQPITAGNTKKRRKLQRRPWLLQKPFIMEMSTRTLSHAMRWRDYFEEISTVEFPHPAIPSTVPTHGPVQKITVEEIEALAPKYDDSDLEEEGQSC
ncbi:unnamed protein product [Heligmosomoides polygyrus]|uniref:HTH_48 domain-containing protein n=1 Tax=Heligmosomoides polygyrus TaxID=6339 RepID=A0A183FR36_HELPZ|nr:unnamed protein product [Heligmosomoides polygyrus]